MKQKFKWITLLLLIVICMTGTPGNAQNYLMGQPAGNTPIQTVGNSGGNVYFCNAPPGYVVVGYEGNGGAFIDKFRLICRQLNSNGTLGGIAYTCYNGVSSGGSFIGSYSFVPNVAFVGGYLRGGNNLDGVGGFGKSVTTINTVTANNVGYSTLNFLGNPSGGSFLGNVFVPNGHVVIGMSFQLTNGGLYAGALGWNYAPIVTLETGAIAQLVHCAPSTVSVPYTATGAYSAGNVFTAQLSNSVGSFASPVTIGSVTSVTSGTITCVIPPGTPNGTGYRIRVISSTTATPSTDDNGSDITINHAPAIICPATIITNADPGTCGAVVSYVLPTFTDNCSGATMVQTAGLSSGSTFPVGTTVNTFTVTNSAGNSASCSFSVVVNDTQPPLFNLPAGPALPKTITQLGRSSTYTNVSLNGQGNSIGVAPGASVTLTGNWTSAYAGGAGCPGCITQHHIGLGSIFNLCHNAGSGSGVLNHTFTAPVAPGIYYINQLPTWWYYCGQFATPVHNNNAADAIAVLVVGNPVACPSDIIVNTATNSCDAVVNYATPSAIDNCGATVTQTAGLPSGASFPIGVTTNTFVATDAAGNSNSCSFTVTVVDNQPPVITCPSNISVNNTPGQCCANVAWALTGSETLDQQMNAFNTGTSGTDQWQSFTAGNSGPLTKITLYKNGIQPTAFTFTVYSGQGIGGAILYTSPYSFGVLSSVNFDVTIPIGVAPLLISGNQYTFRLQSAGNIGILANNLNLYSGGVYSSDFYGGIQSNWDMWFQTYITQPIGATDNCSTPTVTYSHAPGTCFPIGVTTVTATATDAAGNTTNCSFTVTVTDSQNPTITCTSGTQNSSDDGTGNCTFTPTIFGQGGVYTIGDNCPGPYAVTEQFSGALTATANWSLNGGSFTPVQNFPVGVTTVNVTVTDASGNSASCTYTTTIIDNENPVISCPATANISTDPGQCTSSASIGAATATDNCTVTVSGPVPAGPYAIGTTNVVWTATDASGNIATCTQAVIVTDSQNPTITCTSGTQNSSDDGTGNCTFTPTIFGQGGVYTIGDNCSGPYAVTEQFSGALTATANWSLGGGSHTPVQNFPVGVTTVNVTVTDASGNSASCTYTTTIIDNENPVISCPATANISTDPGQCTSSASIGAATATDNCTVTVSGPVPAGPYAIGTTNVVWTATDASGNIVTCTQAVIVTDSQNPTITCTSGTQNSSDDGTGNCTFTPTIFGQGGVYTIGDNCSGPYAVTEQFSGALTATANWSLNGGSFTPVQNFPVGVTTVNVTVTDASGNSASCTYTTTIIDNENPVISCPATANISTDPGQCTSSASIGTATATDNCTVTVSGPVPAGPYAIGTTNVVWTATDASGNTVTCTQAVIVSDSQNPTITCTSGTQNSSDDGTGNCTFTPTLFGQGGVYTIGDNCPGPYSVTEQFSGALTATANWTLNGGSFTPVQIFPVGVTTVNVTVTDANGNSASCTYTTTIIDDEIPVITCAGNISVNNDPGVCGSAVSYAAPVASDNCTFTVGQTNGLPSGAVFPVGTTTNTFVVTDASGNTASCSFNVTVTDTENPTITNCPLNFSSCNPVTWTAPSITDNCAGVQISSSHSPGSNFPFGTTTVTYTATDAYNNVSTCSFDVTRLEESVAADNITSNRDFNNICLGDDITLTINGGSLGEAAQWKWFSGSCGGTALPSFSGMSSITVAPTVTTTYYARAEGICNITSCVSLTVIVSTAAPANGLLSITSAPAIGAVGQSGVVTATNVPGATFYRWTSILGHINAIWFNGSPGPVETATNSVNVSFQIQQQNYQIRVVAGNACGRSNNASAHIRGTVEAATCLDGPVLACPLTTATYSVAACPIPGTSSYQWTIPSGDATITAGQGTHTITVAFGPGFTAAQVCVNGVSTFGLAGPTTCLTVSNSTETPGAISGNDEPCQSGLENYTIAPVTGAVSYIWTTNIAGATASGTTTTGTVQFPAGPFSGQVCVQAVSGCGTSVASCYNVTSGAAGIPGPISGPVSGICGASNVNYTLATNDANSYNWILPAGVTVVSGGSSNSVNVNFAPGLVGPQTITVEAFYNCGSATSSIIVDGAPATPTITPATICAGTDELYFASSAGADNYTWTLTGADYEECTNGNCSQYYVIWNVAGGSLSVTASNSCGTSAPFNLSTNCRVSTTGNMDTKVYPNPTSGNLTIEFSSYAGGQYNLTVTDMAGRSFLTEDVKATSGLNQHSIDLGTANPGLYMLYLKDANGDISVHKITVE